MQGTRGSSHYRFHSRSFSAPLCFCPVILTTQPLPLNSSTVPVSVQYRMTVVCFLIMSNCEHADIRWFCTICASLALTVAFSRGNVLDYFLHEEAA
jgi:hypothetical protein